MIVTGDSDRLVEPARHPYRLAAQLPNSELITLPHAGHELPHTRPGVVVPAIRGLLHQLTLAEPEPRSEL